MNTPAQAHPANPVAGQPSGNTAESECLATARELHLVLREESGILKRFAGSELLQVIAKKEFLICDLGNKLGSLTQTGRVPVASPLGDILGEIDRMNNANRFFIEKSLEHWQDLLSLFCPSGYGPTGETQRSGPPSAKGYAFSREI